MANKIFRGLAAQAIDDLIQYFERSKEIFWDESAGKLIHPGEYGVYREAIVSKLLSLFLPKQYGISSGFIITNSGDVSTQIDIIVYDKSQTPSLETFENQKFFPIETVVAIGEVKSTIKSKADLKSILEKLSETKALRDKTKSPRVQSRKVPGAYDPRNNPFDQIVSFLIAYEFDFELNADDMSTILKDTIPMYRHNLVLSLHSYYLSYMANEVKGVYIPAVSGVEHKCCVERIHNRNNNYEMYIEFLMQLTNAITLTTTLSIDYILYFTDNYTEKI